MIRDLAFALALAAAAAPAMAAAPGGIELRYKDLDFSRASDLAEFQSRIRDAAAALCAKTAADDHRTMLTEGEIRARCEASVRAQVEAQLPKARRDALAAAVPAAPVDLAGR